MAELGMIFGMDSLTVPFTIEGGHPRMVVAQMSRLSDPSRGGVTSQTGEEVASERAGSGEAIPFG